ncbi:sigma-70 family RNA polymerase sigma factor [Enterococcus sp. BWM-S5]|uniref:Sigma-70 family RNA polymerase sigma factor n=1 Tax=Enterococcus larvae TaxID=2794352 RepID=A0ABS4CGC6_9ENTE|nr:sigma-70 family RNA polymerase sigma factor [Enterococcus larvae]MBP1045660.1 sigma-70 family RNA polymerase sigma factor [Enterococcus larvae]
MNGANEKFAVGFEKYYQELFRYAVYLTKNQEQANDLVGNAVYKLLLTIEKVPESQQKFWLLRVIRNEFIDGERRRKRWRILPLHNVKEEFLSAANVEKELEVKQEKEQLLVIVAELPSPYKEVIFHFYYSEMSIKEIQSYFGMSLSQVKTILYRGRNKIKERLLNEGIRGI